MKTFRFSLSLAFLVAIQLTASAQSTQSTQTGLRSEIEKELSLIPNGADLYLRTDLFHRLIDHRAAVRLGLIANPEATESATSALPDTTISGDVYKNSGEQDETTIAINRVNPRLIVAAANDAGMWTASMPAYVSTDAGFSWKMYRLPKISDHAAVASGDPMLVCDDSGMFYYAYMISNDSKVANGQPFITDLLVARSKDGVTWTLGKPILGKSISDFSLEDKETIAVDRDPASPHHGRIYVAWTHFPDTRSWQDVRMIVHSDDHGQTWSQPTEIKTTYGYIALLRVGKGGTLFFGSSHLDSTGSSYAHGMLVSHDGGQSFTERPIADYTDYPQTSWWLNALKGDNGPRSFPYVAFDVDPTSNKLYLVYGNYESDTYASQYAVTSTDEGQTWSDPVAVGSPALIATDHFQPWVSFDPVSRKTYVSLYSSEEDQDTNILTRAVVASFDKLDSLKPIGRTLFNPSIVNYTSGSGAFLGDYTGSDAFGGYYAATWTQNRINARDGDVFAYVTSGVPGAPFPQGSVRLINESQLTVSDPYPNPIFGNSTTMRVTTNEGGTIRVQLFDLSGRQVLRSQYPVIPTGENQIEVPLSGLPAGVYRATIALSSSTIEKNLIILR